MPEREIPGMVAMAWPTPTIRAERTLALDSVLRPFGTRSLAKSRKPVTIRAAPIKSMLLLRP